MSSLISKAVKSPKRAVKKLMLRKGEKKNLLTNLDENNDATDSDLFYPPSSGSLDDHLFLNAIERPGEDDEDHYEYSLSGVSAFDKYRHHDNENPYMSDEEAKKRSKKKGGGGEDGTADDGGGGGYSSDGALAKKKREARDKRAQKRSTIKPKRNKSDFTKSNKKASRDLDGGYSSDHSKKSIGKKPRSLMSLTDDASSHSEPPKSPTRSSTKPQRSRSAFRKKPGGLESSEFDSMTGMRSPGGGTGERPPISKSLRRKQSSGNDNLDDSEHSKRSTKSTTSKSKKRSAKNKRRGSSGDLDGSDHSRVSTASGRSKKGSKKDKSKRGGKKKILSSPKTKLGGASPLNSPRLSPPPDKVNIPKDDVKNLSLSDEVANEIKEMLDDDNNFTGSGSYSGVTKDSPAEQIQNKQEETNVSNAPSNKDISSVDDDGGGSGDDEQSVGTGKTGSTEDQSNSRWKAEKEAMEQRLADIEKLESALADESEALQRAKDDLEYQKEIMTLRLEEETEKSNALRKIVDSYEQEQKNQEPHEKVINDDLRRQVDTLSEENEILTAKLRSVERALETTQKELQKSESRNSSNKALEQQQQTEAAPPTPPTSSSTLADETEALQVEIAKLKEGNQSMAELILQERKENETKLQSKDETISHLMGELGKLKLARGVIPASGDQGGDMGINDGGGGWLGSVFKKSGSHAGLNNLRHQT